jgi:pimeloyl-ACP methyl ester carboxylesterase
MKSYFVQNGSVNIHVLESGVYSSKTPSLLVIGGIWESAERAIPLLSGILSHVIAISFRGRGLSSTPTTGYDLDSHISDINAVVKHCNLKHYCMLGFSRGGAYSLKWTLENQQNMKALIIVDQPPVHTALDMENVEFWTNLVYRGVPILNHMRHEAIEGLAKEAVQENFSTQLSKLKIPVTIFLGRGTKSDIPSNISEDILEIYKQEIPNCNIIDFSKSGHMIPDEEEEKYIEEVNKFIESMSF